MSKIIHGPHKMLGPWQFPDLPLPLAGHANVDNEDNVDMINPLFQQTFKLKFRIYMDIFQSIVKKNNKTGTFYIMCNVY